MRNPYSRVTIIHEHISNPGSRIHLIREPRFNGSRLSLVVTGQEDIQDRINSYGKFTDINYMLHRLSIGDYSVIADHKPMYGDFSEFPKNPVDAINLVRNAEDQFAQLPKDVKSKYDNSWMRWFVDLMNPMEVKENGNAGKVAGSNTGAGAQSGAAGDAVSE